MFSINQRDLYPTTVYVADIYDAKENEEYKKFLIDLSKRDKGRSYLSKKDINLIQYCGKKKYLNHCWKNLATSLKL